MPSFYCIAYDSRVYLYSFSEKQFYVHTNFRHNNELIFIGRESDFDGEFR